MATDGGQCSDPESPKNHVNPREPGKYAPEEFPGLGMVWASFGVTTIYVGEIAFRLLSADICKGAST